MNGIPPATSPSLPSGEASPPITDRRRNLLGLSRERLAAELEGIVDRPYRIGQIYDAIYRRGVTDFAAMTDLGTALRESLTEEFRISHPRVADAQRSSDGTCKFLFRLEDGATIEAVDIPMGERQTLCLSSQAGCALACRFCVTGFWGAGRDLDAGEIVGQVLAIRGSLPRPTPMLNLVFMGMGEPLLNLPAVAESLAILTEAVGWRRITLSTAGVVPGIRALAEWPQRPNLAVSLHAPDDERRSRLMPLNRTYPLAELFTALKSFPLEAGRRLTFEYILIDGFNDSLTDADKVVRLVSGLRAKVNLIPVNPDPVLAPEMRSPPAPRVQAFQRRLVARGIDTTVRRRKGDEVQAACGQLRSADRRPRGFRRSNLSF